MCIKPKSIYQTEEPYPQQLFLRYTRRDVVVVQHRRWRLDDVFGGLPGAAEAVVPGHGEVLIAAAAVLQLKHLTGDHGVLLGHAAHDTTTLVLTFKCIHACQICYAWKSKNNINMSTWRNLPRELASPVQLWFLFIIFYFISVDCYLIDQQQLW